MKIKTVGLLTELKDFMLTLNKVASSVWTTMVGTIVATYAPARQVAKGDEIDYFAFGGSSILILVDRDKITFDADLLDNTRKGIETAVLMGETIGK